MRVKMKEASSRTKKKEDHVQREHSLYVAEIIGASIVAPLDELKK